MSYISFLPKTFMRIFLTRNNRLLSSNCAHSPAGHECIVAFQAGFWLRDLQS